MPTFPVAPKITTLMADRYPDAGLLTGSGLAYSGLTRVAGGQAKQKDADRDGDSELAEFFRRAQETSRRGAEQGKDQLRKRLAS